MKKTRRALALLLASVMIAASPATVLAEEAVNTTYEETAAVTSEFNGQETMTVSEDSETELLTGIVDSDVRFDITDEMMAEKQVLKDIAENLSEADAGEEYRAQEVTYEAADRDEAEQIAKGYCAELASYQDEVAVAKLPETSSTVKAVSAAAMSDVELPAVYPNYIYTIEETAETGEYAVRDLENDTEELQELEEIVTGGAPKPTDPDISKQWFHDNINTFGAWNTAKGTGVKVAVLDTGISQSHNEFAGKVQAVNKVTWDGSTSPEDVEGHGSHVAGLIAANVNNGYGGCGVAPEASILAVRVMGHNASQSGGTTADIVAGLNYAVAQKADAVNMSLGGPMGDKDDVMYENAIDQAYENGVTVVVAAGNDAKDITKKGNKVRPACYKHVITVASLDSDNQLSHFSNYGAGVIDIAAPGGDAVGDTNDMYSCDMNGGYTYMGGTSMACPVTTGVVALILSADISEVKNASGKARVDAVEKVLKASATSLGNTAKYGVGIVNAAAAVGELSIMSKNNSFRVGTGNSLQLIAAYNSAAVAKKADWTSSDTAIATVKNGKVTAVKGITVKSTVTITASTSDGKSASEVITVYPVSSDKLTSNSKTKQYLLMGLEDTGEFAATAGDTPVIYTSSNKKTAIVDTNGKITPLKKGTTNIIAQTVDGKQKLTCKVTVGVPNVFTSLYCKKSTEQNRYSSSLDAYPMGTGTSLTLSTRFDGALPPAYKTPSDKKMEWKSSNEAVVTVKNGKVTAAKSVTTPTRVTITAKALDGTPEKSYFGIATKDVVVYPAIGYLSSRSDKAVSSVKVTLNVGETYNMPLYILDKSKQQKDDCYPYFYIQTKNKYVAKYNSWTITGLKKGKTKVVVNALDGTNRKLTFNVTVK